MSSRILAIDTTADFGSLALVDDETVIEEVLLHSPDGFGHVLFPQIEALLARHSWSYSDLYGFAAASGPGSFTGVRVGLAAAKGLAEAVGVRAAGISNLAAIAWHGVNLGLRAPFLDARRGEIYGAVYDPSLVLIQDEVVMPFGEWIASLPPDAHLYTPDPSPFGALTGGRGIDASPRALAGAIGILAQTRLTDPAALDANYVRRSDAELKWTDR